MNESLFIVQRHIVILRLYQSIIIGDVNLDEVVIFAIILRQPSQYAL